ncbi:tetratricopeptide repeat protein [Methanoregula sp. UBA64]|jgi:tetratricopeptide (TPR) repeat protein|uniref:tetratricopeptide repeat protein n=1 Tax=Methanoregula sp. UBA64 TaxID=1915554 RepID=UPI0025F75E4C|nr:tetratricopeptide repeat protein [Methanoregula sp. UBA64]
MQKSAKVGFLLIIILILVPAVAAEDPLDWYTKGTNAAAAGNYADAVTYYNHALSLDPSYALALSGKAVALNALGQYSNALDAANAALAIRTSSDSLNARAYALYKLGRYNEAIAAYLNVTAQGTPNSKTYCILADSYAKTGSPDAAIKAYAQCTTIDPHNADTWNQIGLIYMSQQQYSNALDAFNKATKETTTNAEIWNNKGKAYAALEQYDDAANCFKAALSLSPNYADAQSNLNSVRGKGQVYQYNVTPTATEAPWVLGGVKTTPPVTMVSVVQTTATVPETTSSGAATATETPVATATTFTPLSPFCALAAFVVAGIACAGAKRWRK